MNAVGPDFISIQVKDLKRSAEFYENLVGLTRTQAGPRHAVVFATTPIPFAVREVLPHTAKEAMKAPGAGVGLWFRAADAQALHDTLAASGTSIAVPPFEGPFGRTFTFVDPDGYQITIHDGE